MQNYQCLTCGATLYWDETKQKLTCRYCDSEFDVSDFEDKTKEPIETQQAEPVVSYSAPEINYKPAPVYPEYAISQPSQEEVKYVIYACTNCGGEIIATETTMATICPYCGEAVNITSKSVGDFRPELIIPFKITKQQSIDIYKKYIEKIKFLPKTFTKDNVIEKIQGMYIPYQLHTIKAFTHHNLQGTITQSHRRGDDKVTITEKYDLRLFAESLFSRFPTDASRQTKNSIVEKIEDFDYRAITKFNPAYMAGYVADQKDDDPDVLQERAMNNWNKMLNEKVLGNFSKYTITENNMEQNIESHTEEYAMLPVWVLNIKSKNIVYTVMVNGQTGTIYGELPLNKAALDFYVFAITAGVNSAILIALTLIAILGGLA